MRRAGTLSVASLRHGARSGLLRQGTVEEVALNYSLKKTVFFFFSELVSGTSGRTEAGTVKISQVLGIALFLFYFFLVSILH